MIYYFMNHFFITLYYFRMHCVQFALTKDLNDVQSTKIKHFYENTIIIKLYSASKSGNVCTIRQQDKIKPS